MENKWRKPTELLPPLTFFDEGWYESELVLICTNNSSRLYKYQIAYYLRHENRGVWVNPVNGMVTQSNDVRYWREIEPAPNTDD